MTRSAMLRAMLFVTCALTWVPCPRSRGHAGRVGRLRNAHDKRGHGTHAAYRFACALLCVLASATIGCAKLEKVNRAALPRAQMSADAVVLDLFFVRVPLGAPLANEQLWADADEQQLPADLRVRLADHGFRVGVLGSQIPPALEKLVDDPLAKEKAAVTDDAETTSQIKAITDPNAVTQFEAEPRVMQRHLQLRAGMPSEIIASKERESLVLLESQDGLVGGRTYRKGLGVLQLKSFPQADGRVRIEVVPELHHDDPKIEYVDQAGAWIHDVRRPRRTFPELKVDATLAPGEMLVITNLPDQSGTLGYHCFTESTSRGVSQKLLIVRLSQTQHTGAE